MGLVDFFLWCWFYCRSLCNCIHCFMVSSIRTIHTLMGKRRTITYTLSDGKKVTCREISKLLDITETAARHRLNHSDDPKVIYKPYDKKTGGKKRVVDRTIGTKKNKEHKPTKDEELWKLVMRMGVKK